MEKMEFEERIQSKINEARSELYILNDNQNPVPDVPFNMNDFIEPEEDF
jgi:hypothetical protein